MGPDAAGYDPPVHCAEYPHDDVWDALREVGDPELGISLVDMGMVVAAWRADTSVHIQLTYTSMGCPATEMIDEDVRARLLLVPGVERVILDVVWDPCWSKARLTAEGRDALHLVGVSV
jgi:metal-sulfur cluster biosynthetic enzyme